MSSSNCTIWSGGEKLHSSRRVSLSDTFRISFPWRSIQNLLVFCRDVDVGCRPDEDAVGVGQALGESGDLSAGGPEGQDGRHQEDEEGRRHAGTVKAAAVQQRQAR